MAVAEAPWKCRCRAVVWVSRPTSGVAAALPPALRGRRPLALVGGMLRYLDTPVGRYDEVFAAIAIVHRGAVRGHVPFMAVDSADSLQGGRENWALPKEMATFAGAPEDGETMTGRADGWEVSATPRAHGRALPVFARGSAVQAWPGGLLRTAGLTLRGRARPAMVTVEAEGTGLLAPGRHPGAVFETARFTLARPR